MDDMREARAALLGCFMAMPPAENGFSSLALAILMHLTFSASVFRQVHNAAIFVFQHLARNLSDGPNTLMTCLAAP